MWMSAKLAPALVSHNSSMQKLDQLTREQLVLRGQYLSYLTVGWNALEGIVAVLAGLLAGSVALVGFGFDSAIETLSGAIMIWRLYSDSDEQNRERVEALSLRLVGLSFILLALYVGYDSIKAILGQEPPQPSTAGLVIAALSLIVMPWLATQKRKVASQIQSSALTADAKQTDFCFYLSIILLSGLALNAIFHWWWADPVAALIMVPFIAKEGVEGVRGKSSCCNKCH